MLALVECNADGIVSGILAAEDPTARFVDLTIRGVFLRRVPARIERSDLSSIPYIRGFWFSFDPSLIDLLPKGAPIEIRDVKGRVIDAGVSAKVAAFGKAEDGEALSAAFARGEFVDKWGALKLPFSASSQKRVDYARQMERVIYHFHQMGIVIFPHYGSLLGLVRNGKFIDHDDDVDLSIFIRAGSLEEVVDRFYGIIDVLHEEGHTIEVVETGQFFLSLRDWNGPLMDVFLTWQLSDLDFSTYFGVSGKLAAPLKFGPAKLEGVDVLIPQNAEEIVELTFGPNWRTPDSNFLWQPSSHVRDTMAELKLVGAPRLAATRIKLANTL